jgi:hypothetical protein
MLSSSFLSALHVYRNKLGITVGRVEKLRRVYFRLERNQGRILSGAEERDAQDFSAEEQFFMLDRR